MEDAYPSGQFFYHYTSSEVAFEHILPERQLLVSPYSEMRDPLENKLPPLEGSYDVRSFRTRPR